jgi:hypothetical protein
VTTLKRKVCARYQWLMPVILTTQEAELRRIAVWSQPEQIVCETLSRKTLITQNWAGRVAQSEGLEFKPQDHQKQKKRKYAES